MKKLLSTKYVAVMFTALLLSSVNAVAVEDETASPVEAETLVEAAAPVQPAEVYCIHFPAGFGSICFDI